MHTSKPFHFFICICAPEHIIKFFEVYTEIYLCLSSQQVDSSTQHPPTHVGEQGGTWEVMTSAYECRVRYADMLTR